MSLIAELKRRNVFRVGVAYVIVAWLLVEVASVLLPAFKVPEWVFQAFVILVVLTQTRSRAGIAARRTRIRRHRCRD